ncbi:MAG: T9SS type A sorting domain-containing protein, partial [Candidatus Marinimicrobia bacterium]|nr:T9SS type A sorting domain-containing protein [Candidatus Neomarinimicrobiota bacterium]
IGRDIDADDVLICTALPDLSQTSKGLEKMKLGCSSISSWGASTQEDSALAGQLIITRLMDWDNHFALCRNHLLIVQIPAEEDEQKWISLAFTGFLGSLSGINESGIGAFMNVGNKTEFKTDSLFYPILFTLRNGIEMRDYNRDLSSDTDDILDAVRQRNRSAAAIIHTVINLGNESDPMIIECNNVKGVITRNQTNNTVVQGKNLLATNHFRLLYTPESCNRYSGVTDSLQNNVNISPDRSWTILADAAGVSWNLHGIQYNESSRELKWATSTVSTAAYLQNPTVFNLDDLFYPETGIKENISAIIQKFRLSQNYPNPFNPTTTIRYDIPKTSQVTLTIYNMNGHVVDKLVNQKQEPGFYSVNWNASQYSSGVYIYRIQADGFSAVKNCILMK